jgi:hypothetical protein
MKICSRSVGPVIVASVNRWKKELQSAEKPGQHGSFAGPIASLEKKELHSAELTANGIRRNGRKA